MSDFNGEAPHLQPTYETFMLRMSAQRRDINEIDVWLNSMPGRVISVFNHPLDTGVLCCSTVHWNAVQAVK